MSKIAVIGGGPAGIMAALQASYQGASVTIYEKNHELGLKLLLTGGGRCNLTHAEFNNREFLKAYGKDGRFLYSAFNNFGLKDTVKFFEDIGIETKTESTNKIFPICDDAIVVRDILVQELKNNNIKIFYNKAIKNLDDIKVDKYIITTGGMSYPGLGCTGDGYKIAKKIGHNIIEPKPALTPIILKPNWISQLAGVSFDSIKINIVQNNKIKIKTQGQFLFTHLGASGPAILNISKQIGELLEQGKVYLSLDLLLELDNNKLDKLLQEKINNNTHKLFKNILDKIISAKLANIVIKLAEINEKTKCCDVNKKQRKKIVYLIKNFSIEIKALDGFKKAMVTTGGIDIKEIDPKTMQSKINPAVYFAGEVLDVDGLTGGYNLQMCWSTGFTAGVNSVY